MVGQRVKGWFGGNDEDQFLLPEGDYHDVRVRDGLADQSQVALERENAFHDRLGIAYVHLNLDPGMLLPEEINDIR